MLSGRLESMNREATADAIKAMRGRLEAARATMRLMTGYAVEVHRQIKVDEPLPVSEFRIGAGFKE